MAELDRAAAERLSRAFPNLDVPTELQRSAQASDYHPLDPNGWFFDLVRHLSRKAGRQP